MANLIRFGFALFWLAASGLIGFLAYVVVQTEADPQRLWGWLAMCGFTFMSVSFLTYNIIFGHNHKPQAPHHDAHLNS